MRIELEDEKEKIQEIDHNDIHYKHESDLTKKEKRLLEKEKLAGMGLGGKLQYLWAYYKWVLVVVIAVTVVVRIVADSYHNSQIDTVLAVDVIDSDGTGYEEMLASMEAMTGADEDEYKQVELSMNFKTGTDESQLDTYDQMAFITRVQAGTEDLVVAPEALCEELDESGYFIKPEDVLDTDTYERLSGCIQGNYLVLTDSSLTESLGLYYDTVCIGVFGNTENVENCAAWIASVTS